MAKRAASGNQKLFSLDLESLLLSDFSPEKLNEPEKSISESFKPSKKFKTKEESLCGNIMKTTNEELENYEEEKIEEEKIEEKEISDVTKFFENVGNDFNKSLQVRKSRLRQFTDAVILIHQSKITEMINKHQLEIEELREQTVSNVEKELNKCEEDFKKLKLQENKLIKILEQQMKLVQKTTETQTEWIQHFRKMHQNFVQAFEALKSKHKTETMDLKKSLASDVSDLQTKFLIDSKKEEMETVKKYLSSIYF